MSLLSFPTGSATTMQIDDQSCKYGDVPQDTIKVEDRVCQESRVHLENEKLIYEKVLKASEDQNRA
jgi:hypothetical protein